MAETPESARKALKILVVEDSPTQLAELRFLLEESGFSVVAATNGKEGLAAAKANAIDLVISDIVMPEMDGYALCKALREDETCRHLPVVLLTSLTDPRDVIQGLESGANNFICKPYDDRGLVARVQNVLTNQEIRRAASSEMGISIFFAGQPFFITADRLQILDLLLSTYEVAIQQNRELLSAREELQSQNVMLEKKVRERTANLMAEIAERERAEWALRERMKELTCLSVVRRCLQEDLSVDELCRRTVENLVPAVQFPEITVPVIELKGKRYTSENYTEALSHSLHSEIRLEGEAVGHLRVSYVEERPFLIPEKQDLVNGVAEILSTWLERRRAEAVLRESEARYRAVAQSANLAIVTADSAGNIVDWNPRAETMFGYTAAEVLGQPLTLLIPEQQRELHLAGMRRVQSGGESHVIGRIVELAGRRKDSSEFPLELSLAKWRTGEGWFVTGMMADITERNRAAEESQIVLRTAMDGFSVVDLQGRFLEANEAYCRLIGYTRDELLAIRITDIEAAESPEATTAHIAAVMRTGSDRFLTRHRRKDGEVLDVEVSANYLPLNGGRIFIFVRDITARVQTQAELRRLRLAVDASNEVIFMTDLEGVITSVNPAFTRLYGYSAAEVVGKTTPRILKSGAMPQEAYESFWNAILSKQVVTGELINKTRDGRLLTVESSVNPILNEQGESIGFLAIQHDITERKQLEAQFRQAQKMESVGQLTSGIAHDFNNLVTVINGMSELVLAQLSQDEPAHADVQEIQRAGERAATLTRQLLAFSRQQILEPRVLKVNTVVAGMEDLLRRLLGEDIDLVVVLTPGLGSVKVDPGQIEQVITNLAVNARDAMPQGGQLTIETENVTIDEDYARQHGVAVPPGSYVLLAVSDSGVGMDEATRARIFEPFFTTKGPGKGTGLGLSTVFGIVKQSLGCLWVYSEVGRGTSFKVLLPQVTEAAGPDPAARTVAPKSGTETILLAEDNAGLRKLATRVLEPAGYTVLGAATGEEALRLLERHEPPVHLLLSDVVMPGMSGRDLAEQLAQTRPGMKVLYMSGYTSDTVVRHGVLEAQVPFLNKPFTAAALLGKVREVLDSQA